EGAPLGRDARRDEALAEDEHSAFERAVRAREQLERAVTPFARALGAARGRLEPRLRRLEIADVPRELRRHVSVVEPVEDGLAPRALPEHRSHSHALIFRSPRALTQAMRQPRSMRPYLWSFSISAGRDTPRRRAVSLWFLPAASNSLRMMPRSNASTRARRG